MADIADPIPALGDSSCGLDIRGYKLVPNDALLIKLLFTRQKSLRRFFQTIWK
jgi:hypothetical protein